MSDAAKTEIRRLTKLALELEQREADLRERLLETDSMLEAVCTQMESWGHRPVVNVNGCRDRNRKVLGGVK